MTQLKSIFKINNDLITLFLEIQEAEGNLTPELEERLTRLRKNISLFTQDTGNIVKMLSSDITTVDAEIKRLEEIKAKRQKLIDKIEVDILALVLREGTIDKNSKAKIKPSFIDFELGKAVGSFNEIVLVNEDEIEDEDCLFDLNIPDLTSEKVMNLQKTLTIEKIEYKKIQKYPRKELKKRIEAGEEISGVEIINRPKLSWK